MVMRISKAVDDVIAERVRQIEVEGYDEAHDDKHTNGEIANAAACFAMTPWRRSLALFGGDTVFDRIWPWAKKHWKPKDRRHSLVVAGALIIAEIERIDRIKKDD